MLLRILMEFLSDYTSADVIRGYRADDSYFSFAFAFLSVFVLSLQIIRHISRKKLHVTG